MINVEDSCNIIIITGQRGTALKIIYNIYRVLRFPVAFLLPNRRPSQLTPTNHIYILYIHTHTRTHTYKAIGKHRPWQDHIFDYRDLDLPYSQSRTPSSPPVKLPSTVHFARITERTSSAFICGGVRPQRSTRI